jgi:hypothetical protein
VPGPQGSLPFGNAWASLAPVERLRVQSPPPPPPAHVYRCNQNSSQAGYQGLRNVYTPTTRPCTTTSSSFATGTAQACVSDPNEFVWNSSSGQICPWQTSFLPWDSWKPHSGPNLNCPTAMLGLSGNRAQVIAKLDHMYPVQGGTMADIGLMWSLRALSPRSQWENFFGHTGAKAPRAFNAPDVRKIVILLTDGKNETPYHFEGYYGCTENSDRGNAGACWRSPGVNQLNNSVLDGLTLDACNALTGPYGVELYTIAVDVTDPGAINLLQTCAGDPNRAFNITAGQLDATFQAIAERTLRLTQ